MKDIKAKGFQEIPHKEDYNSLNNMKEVGMSQFPIEALEAAVNSFVDLGMAFYQAEANDGKITVGDAPLLFTPVLGLITSLTGGDFKHFGEQVGDIDSVESEKLKSDYNAKVDGSNLTAEEKAVAKNGFATLLSFGVLYKSIKDLKASQNA